MKIIGLTGLPRVGKDSIAREILSRLPGGKILKFADKLYDEVAEATGVPRAVLESDEAKTRPGDYLSFEALSYRPQHGALAHFLDVMMLFGSESMHCTADSREEWRRTPRTSRDILRWWGTEFRRTHCGSDYWASAALAARAVAREEGVAYVVYSDVRFDNEASALIREGGIIVEVTSAGVERDGQAHASDGGVNPGLIHLRLPNNKPHEGSASPAGVVAAVNGLAAALACPPQIMHIPLR